MENQERHALVKARYLELYGAAPEFWVRAPGRVDLMGSHTDYNLGYVLTMTVDRDTWIVLRPRPDHRVRIHSLNLSGSAEFGLDGIGHDDRCLWTDYVRAMAWVLDEAGYTLTGFDGLIHSTIPFGSGLSSSAAIEMAAGMAFQAVGGFRIEPARLAVLGQRAENQFVGVNCGILDQYSSALGQAGSALLLDCRDLSSRAVPLAPGIQVVICDTRAARNLAGTEYDERRAQCEEGVRILQWYYPGVTALRDVSMEMFRAHVNELPPIVARRCRFIIEENERVLSLADVLSGGERDCFRELMQASYSGARDLYEIGAPALAAMSEATHAAPGLIGARQAGAGFGGCMVAFVEEKSIDSFTEAVERRYAATTGIVPQVYAVQPAPAAGMLDM